MCAYDEAAPVARSWTFDVGSEEAASLNSHQQNDARGWAYRKMRDRWVLLLRSAARAGGIPRPEERRRITLTRLYSGRQRELDRDNLVGGLKAVVDALRRADLILDDTRRWAQVHYLQERGDRRGLRVQVEEVGSP